MTNQGPRKSVARMSLATAYHETTSNLAGNPAVPAVMHAVVKNQFVDGYQPAIRAMC